MEKAPEMCFRNESIGKVDLAKVRGCISTELSKTGVSNAIEEYNISTLPIAEQMCYSYDYGEGWKVLITCENSYKLNIYECNMDDKEELI